MKAPILYALPGLGADERIFSRIRWPLPLRYLPLLPQEKGDTLPAYAARMAAGIEGDRSAILLGLSFGGVVAQEIARIRPVQQLLLLSTIKSAAEKPPLFRLMRFLPLYELSRGRWRIRSLPLWAPRFGVRSPEEIELLRAMFSEVDDTYRMWAIRQIIDWNPPPEPAAPYAHLHGTKDQVFPARYLHGAQLIPGGNHFMVYQEAERVGEWIAACTAGLRPASY